MQRVRSISALLMVGLLAVACSSTKAEPPAGSQGTAGATPSGAAADITPEAQAEAKDIFANRCTPCHGSSGAGDGPASAGLTPKPRNFRDAAWQKTITDDHIEKIIKFGGTAVGKSAAMPPNPDLGGKPAVVAALRSLVRQLAQ